jgi:hypothetical protein
MSPQLALPQPELRKALLILRTLQARRKPVRYSAPLALLELADLVERLPQPTASLTTLAAESIRLWATGPVGELFESGHDRILAMVERWVQVQLKRSTRPGS